MNTTQTFEQWDDNGEIIGKEQDKIEKISTLWNEEGEEQ